MSDEIVTGLIDQSIKLENAGQEGAAFQHAQQALELAQSQNNLDGAASALVRIGDLHYRLGHFNEAQQMAERALSMAGKRSHPRVDAFILLGNCLMEVGTLDETERYYQAAADLSRQIDYRQALVNALHDLGACIYALRGQFSLAIAAEQQAYSLACQLDATNQAVMLISLCFDFLLTGQYQQVKEIRHSLHSLTPKNLRFQGYDFIIGGYLYQVEGDLPLAYNYFNQARTIAETTGDLGLNIFLRLGLSAYHQMAGNFSEAYDWANDAVDWANRVGTHRFVGRTLTERGRAAWLLGDLATAEGDLRLAIQELSSRKQAYDLARAQLILAALLYQEADPEAESMYIEAISLLVSGGFTYLLERERALVFPLIAHFSDHPNPSMQALTTTLLARLMSVPAPALRIFTFGRFEVFRQGVKIPEAAWHRQAGELFRLLLVSPNRSLSREQIIDCLWPEKSPSRSITFFHQATSCLRRALEPDLPDKFPSRYLLVEEGRVTLWLPNGSLVDYEQFELHLQHEEYDLAIQYYRGEPLVKDRYHDWASSKREQLIQLHIMAVLSIATENLASGKAEEALAGCLQVLADEPWNEQAGLLAMHACIRLNNRPAALRIYQNLASCLEAEFGILPMPEISSLYHSIKAPQ